ncbi:PREDICTED: CD63 antigen-like [Branchiostoma belcheri]|uniref:Tetraspanin n=1 Tax=Branchiostoma belcheri TaxID=7741 RepID=A0A6P4XTH4_BRABE|nr:PREDICTED: CD63 antigen-like [Branchiostoma belcheri]
MDSVDFSPPLRPLQDPKMTVEQLGIGHQMMRYCLIAFNIVFFVAGFGLMVVAAASLTWMDGVFDFSRSDIPVSQILLLVVGLIICVVTVVGCYGAEKDNVYLLKAYAGILSILLLLTLIGGILGFQMRGKLRSRIKEDLMDFLRGWNPSNRKAFDLVQKKLQCCGVENYTEWENSGFPQQKLNGSSGLSVPGSCCITALVNFDLAAPNDTCGADLGNGTTVEQAINTEGCLNKLESGVKSHLTTVAVLGILLLFVQVIGIVFACLLARGIQNYQYSLIA